MRRLHIVEEVHERIAAEINSQLVGTTHEVLVESRRKGKWSGRTRTNKLVFFEDETDWQGELVDVKIDSSTAWSLQGSLARVRALPMVAS